MAVRTVVIVMAVWIFTAAGVFAPWFAWIVTAIMVAAFFRWVARQTAAAKGRLDRGRGAGD